MKKFSLLVALLLASVTFADAQQSFRILDSTGQPITIANPFPTLGNLSQVGGTNAVNGGIAGSLGVGGTAGSDAAITQNPVLSGCEVITSGSQPTAATTGRGRYCVQRLDGVPFVHPGGPVTMLCGLNNIAASLTECTGAAAPASGLAHYITTITASSTTTTAGTFAVQSGTGANCGSNTTAIWPRSGTSDRWTSPPTTAAPVVIMFSTPIRMTTVHAICAIGVATNTLRITISGFTAP